MNRQVLADPAVAMDAEVWATLADGTPLVTAAKQGEGWIVLFHVTANSDWSNLPLSGLFVRDAPPDHDPWAEPGRCRAR